MRVLVTGAGGFLGSHLCSRLVSDGHEVLGVDNFFTGSKQNLAHLAENQNFELIRHDITHPLFVEVDAIYNLASPASPIHYQRDPVQTMKTNVLGAVNILGLAKRLNVPVFQASTSEVYGDPMVHPQKEEYWGNVNPIGPRACYDEGKRAAETLFFDYHRQHGVKIRVARIFNTYGPRLAAGDGRVISNFVLQALSNREITIFGAGTQTRSFCYVTDLVDGFLSMMSSSEPLVGPVNLGNPEEHSIRDVAQRIIQLTGSTSQLVLRELPQDDPKRRRPDITRAKNLLGWEPKVGLDEGLGRTIDYFRDRLRA